MAAPTAATAALIVAEGLAKAGDPSPSSALTTRATDNWLREIKNDIWRLGKNLKSLQTTYIQALTEGQAQYELPTDFSSLIDLQLLDGINTGTAQAGAVGTVTLAASSSFTEEFLQGKEIYIYAGTNIGSSSHIISYNTSTKVATVEPDFTSAIDNTSKYIIVDAYYPVQTMGLWDKSKVQIPYNKQKPQVAFIKGDSDSGKLIVYPIPDKTYGLKIEYYANLMFLDLASTTMSTLYRYWETVFIQGVFARRLADRDDSRASAQIQLYNQMIKQLVGEETYGTDLHELQRTIA